MAKNKRISDPSKFGDEKSPQFRNAQQRFSVPSGPTESNSCSESPVAPSTLGVSMVGGVCWRSSIHSNTSEMGKKWSFFVFHTSSPSKIVIIWSPKSDRVRLQTDQLGSPESSQRNDLQPSIVVQPGKLSSMYPKKEDPDRNIYDIGQNPYLLYIYIHSIFCESKKTLSHHPSCSAGDSSYQRLHQGRWQPANAPTAPELWGFVGLKQQQFGMEPSKMGVTLTNKHCNWTHWNNRKAMAETTEENGFRRHRHATKFWRPCSTFFVGEPCF